MTENKPSPLFPLSSETLEATSKAALEAGLEAEADLVRLRPSWRELPKSVPKTVSNTEKEFREKEAKLKEESNMSIATTPVFVEKGQTVEEAKHVFTNNALVKMQEQAKIGAQLADDAKTLGLKVEELDDEPKGQEMPLVKCVIQQITTVLCDPCPGCGAKHGSVQPEVVKVAQVGKDPIKIDCSCGTTFAAIRSRIISSSAGQMMPKPPGGKS